MGRVLVIDAVPGQEGDPASAHVTDANRRGGRPVGRVDRDLLAVVEQRIEARSAEDPQLGLRSGGHRDVRLDDEEEADVVDDEPPLFDEADALSDEDDDFGPTTSCPTSFESDDEEPLESPPPVEDEDEADAAERLSVL